MQELQGETVRLNAANAALQAAEQRARELGEEAARLLPVQQETLAQCYRVNSISISHGKVFVFSLFFLRKFDWNVQRYKKRYTDIQSSRVEGESCKLV